MRICANCGATNNSDGSPICQKCGALLPVSSRKKRIRIPSANKEEVKEEKAIIEPLEQKEIIPEKKREENKERKKEQKKEEKKKEVKFFAPDEEKKKSRKQG